MKSSSRILFWWPFLFYGVSAWILKPWSLDFPLNDDWAYALGVRRWVQEGQFHLCDWTTVTQVLQIFWGGLWVKIGGWSQGILKISTLTLAALSALSLDASLRILEIPSRTRLLTVLLWVVNPLTFCLSFSFMTDIPYLFLLLLAFTLILKAEKTGSDRWVWLGSLCAAGAYLIRQTGILIPLGYFSYLVLQRRLSFKKSVALWGLPLLTVLGHGLWFHFIHGPTWSSLHSGPTEAWHTLLRLKTAPVVFLRLLSSGLLLGWMTFPLALAFKVPKISPTWKWGLAAYALASLVFVGLIGWMPQLGRLPYWGNYLTPWGLGVPTLGEVEAKAAGFFGWGIFWRVLTVLSLAGILMNLALWGTLRKPMSSLERAAVHLFLITGFAQWGVAALRDAFFDRYVLALLPGFLIILALASKRHRFRPIPAGVGILMLWGMGFWGTMDYLHWNKARWAAGVAMVQKGLSPDQIANGFEWAGYWSYEKNLAALKQEKPLEKIGRWEWLGSRPYQLRVSFSSENPGHALIHQEPYDTPLSFKKQFLYVWTY
ncbi:MAG: glycosyltransferase family 39 protein [Elusimicrobia bacterium]|nr:glycosyltransferase family 39 protein [Elusimicrobiota bacterium]